MRGCDTESLTFSVQMAHYRLFQRGYKLGLLEHEVLGYCNSFRVPVQMHYLNASVFDLVGQKVKGVVGEEDARGGQGC